MNLTLHDVRKESQVQGQGQLIRVVGSWGHLNWYYHKILSLYYYIILYFPILNTILLILYFILFYSDLQTNTQYTTAQELQNITLENGTMYEGKKKYVVRPTVFASVLSENIGTLFNGLIEDN